MSQEQQNEDFTSSYLPLIKGANAVLDMLSSVWRYCVTVLLISLLVIGVLSIGLYFVVARQVLFTEGIIFLAISAWIFYNNVTGACNRCCTADIPRWKRILSSFVEPNNSVDMLRDGESVVENLMRLIDESIDWIRLIRRDVFSVLFWPIIAVVLFVFSIYSADVVLLQATAIGLIVYVFVLTTVIYYSVNAKFRSWQEKVSRFKGYTASAIENL